MVSRARKTLDQHNAPCSGDRPAFSPTTEEDSDLLHTCLFPGPIFLWDLPWLPSSPLSLRTIPGLSSLQTLRHFRIVFHIHVKSIIFLAWVHPLLPTPPHSGSQRPVPSLQNCLRRQGVPDTSLLSAGRWLLCPKALPYYL